MQRHVEIRHKKTYKFYAWARLWFNSLSGSLFFSLLTHHIDIVGIKVHGRRIRRAPYTVMPWIRLYPGVVCLCDVASCGTWKHEKRNQIIDYAERKKGEWCNEQTGRWTINALQRKLYVSCVCVWVLFWFGLGKSIAHCEANAIAALFSSIHEFSYNSLAMLPATFVSTVPGLLARYTRPALFV